MSLRLLHLTFAVVLALTCSVPAAFSQSLTGKWYGSASPQSGTMCWVNERRSDGTYVVNFLVDRDGKLRRHREEGTWFLSNGLFATLTQRINGQPTDPKERRYRDVYRVVELTPKRFSYADIGSDAQFSVERVPDSFELGDACPKAL